MGQKLDLLQAELIHGVALTLSLGAQVPWYPMESQASSVKVLRQSEGLGMLQTSHHIIDLIQQIYRGRAWNSTSECGQKREGEAEKESQLHRLYEGHTNHGASGNMSHLGAGDDKASYTDLLKVSWKSTWFWNMGDSQFSNHCFFADVRNPAR